MTKIANEIDTLRAMMKAAGHPVKEKKEEGKVDTMENTINLYTDGACRGNGETNNVGAFAYHLEYKGHTKEGAWTKENTTNNAMELAAVVAGLNQIRTTDIPVVVYTDSAYVVGCATKWMDNWRSKGYRKSKGALKNRSLIIAMDQMIQKQKDIRFVHVKGHSGHPGNERVDTLCNIEMDKHIVTV